MWIFGLNQPTESILLSGDSNGDLIAWDLENILARNQKANNNNNSNNNNNNSDSDNDVLDQDGDVGMNQEDRRDANGEGDDDDIAVTSVFQAHNNPIYDICFHNDKVFTGADEEIRIWKKTEDKQQQFSMLSQIRIPQIEGFRGARSPVAETNGITLLENGNKIGAAAGDSNGYIFDVEKNTLMCTLAGHKDYLHSIAAIEAAGLIATGSEDGTCKLWDIRQTECVATLNIGDLVTSVLVSDDLNWLAVGGSKKNHGIAAMCHIGSRVITNKTVCKRNGRVQAMTFTRDNLVVAGNSSEIEYWDKNGREFVASIPSSNTSILALSYCDSSGILASGGSSRYVDVFSAERNQMMSLCA